MILYCSAVYQSWRMEFCSNHPQIDIDKVVFDNDKIILVYEQPLPDIDENVSILHISLFFARSCLITFSAGNHSEDNGTQSS
jgi:hypothetical protein